LMSRGLATIPDRSAKDENINPGSNSNIFSEAR